MFESEVLGVLEFASLRPFSHDDNELLDSVALGAGVAIAAIEAAQKTRELLQVSKAQTEELQTQEEELRAANEQLIQREERLSAQNAELEEQTEQLRSQKEELKASSETLEAQADALEKRTTNCIASVNRWRRRPKIWPSRPGTSRNSWPTCRTNCARR